MDVVRERVKKEFMKNRHETDPAKLEKLIEKGNYILKEMEALISLKKYRTLKRRYYDNAGDHLPDHNKLLEMLNEKSAPDR